MNVLTEKIIVPAWKLVKDDARLKRIYFFPGLILIITFTVLLAYQVIYTYVKVFWQKEKVLELILEFIHSSYFFEVIVTGSIFALIYFFIMPIFDGALISYIDEKQKEERVSFSDALWVGLFRFLPVFEYNNSFNEFKLINLLNAYLFSIRFLGLEYVRYINIMFVFWFVFVIIMNVFLAYTKYEIVLWGNNVLKSIWVSWKIAILNPKTTIKLYFLMFILNIRVLLNFIVFLIFPIAFFSALAFIWSTFFLAITLGVLLILFVFLVVVLWYLSWVLEIFKTSIWYFAYIEGKKKLHTHHHEDEGH